MEEKLICPVCGGKEIYYSAIPGQVSKYSCEECQKLGREGLFRRDELVSSIKEPERYEELRKSYKENHKMKMQNGKKELHVYLGDNYPEGTIFSYEKTEQAIEEERRDIIHTTQTHFVSFTWVDMGYELYVHDGLGRVIHPVLNPGENDNQFTERDLRRAHNLERLLIAGAFDFQKGDISKE